MALVDVNRLSVAGGSFGRLPITKQLTVLIAVAMSVALGVFVVLWARTPNMAPLYAKLDGADASKVIEVLQKNDVQYKYDPGNGGLLVPVHDIHNIRMKLAAQGLPNGTGVGYEILDKPQGFNTSQFMENIRYRRGLEGELAKTISSLKFVRESRVHLGLPKQASFLRKNTASSASVMVELYGGHQLDKTQVDGIVHLVASSVPELKRENITVVDQHGNLLTSNSNNLAFSSAMEEMNYTRQKEQELARKIHELLSPIYGSNGVRAEVTADLDFTFTEKTLENFDNAKPTVRSEAVVREQRTNDSIAMGIPGALYNQPPSLIGAPEKKQAANQAGDEEGGSSKETVNYRDQATRNYEVDKTITHEKKSIGKLNKLSVAVVINDRTQYDASGNETRTPLAPEELTKVKTLVKDAIGFNDERGDKVTVINSSFAVPPPIVPKDAANDLNSMLQQPWFIPAVKQLLGGIFVLFILFAIIKPIVRSLSELKLTENKNFDEQENVLSSKDVLSQSKAKLNLLPSDMETHEKVEQVKQIAHDDSRRAAQVVMNWVGREDE